MYSVIVLYERKRVVGLIVTTLKILGMMILCEVWCISPEYACYFMVFNVNQFLFLVWAMMILLRPKHVVVKQG
jgi:hypothetical protein